LALMTRDVVNYRAKMADPIISMNCPRCGRPMRFVDATPDQGLPFPKTDNPAETTYFTFECDAHGRFHSHGPQPPLTPGLPPTVA
jgi:hypothetical protein